MPEAHRHNRTPSTTTRRTFSDDWRKQFAFTNLNEAKLPRAPIVDRVSTAALRPRKRLYRAAMPLGTRVRRQQGHWPPAWPPDDRLSMTGLASFLNKLLILEF